MAHPDLAQRPNWAHGILEEARFALRLTARERWFTTAAVITLGLGLAVSTVVFSIANGFLLRPLPFPGSQRLVHIGLGEPGTRYGAVSYADYLLFQEARMLERIAAFSETRMTLAGDGYGAERLQGAFISAGALDLVGSAPIRGRTFSSGDHGVGAAPTALLAESVWTRRYARDPAILGRDVRVNGVTTSIVGVLPDAAGFPGLAGARTEIWKPLESKPASGGETQESRTLGLVGRIADGTTIAGVRDEIAGFTARLQQDKSPTSEPVAIVVGLRNRYIPVEVAQLVWVLLGAGTLVLIIAWVNVLNLSIVRTETRHNEIATRAAVGATRRHIARQLLIESAILSLAAGGVAAVMSTAAIHLLTAALAVVNPPFWVSFDVDWRVAAYLAFMCTVSCIILSVQPIGHVVRAGVREQLYRGGWIVGPTGRTRRVSQVMVGVEVALTAVLLIGGGLMVRAFMSLYGAELGFETQGMMVLNVDMSGSKYTRPEDRARLADLLEERLRATSVLRAAIASSPPGAGGPGSWALTMDRRPAEPGTKPPTVMVIAVGDEYFEVLRRTVLTGRPFVRGDGASGQGSAIVNQQFVSMYSPAESPIGRQIKVDRTGRVTQSSGWMEIVGITPSVRERDALLQSGPEPVVYVPFRALPTRTPVVVATGPGLDVVLRQVRAELLALDPDLPVFDVRTLDDVLAFSRWPQRVFGGILMTLALVALVLASVGVYGVTAQAVAARRREIAVRMALGAQRSQVLRLMWLNAFLPLAIGLVGGVVAALSTGRLLAAFLVAVDPREPTIFTIVVGVLLAVGLFASLIPARRASRLDPLVGLRYE